MGLLHLSIELLFDLVAFILGCVIIYQAKDNYLKLYWGVIASGIGLFFIWENVGWLLTVTDNPSYHFADLLHIEKMLKWYALASLVALFPTASLRPGYFNHFRVFIFLLPPVIIITIGLSYLNFNGYVTPIFTLEQIASNWGKPDIQFRLILFLLTIVTPLAFMIYPLTSKNAYRQINRNMYLLIGFMFLFLAIYILFTLHINAFIFNLFGITALVFTLLFSVLYLFHENPFSDPVGIAGTSPVKEWGLSPAPDTLLMTLFIRIDQYVKEQRSYMNSDYLLKDLAKELDEKEYIVTRAIKEGGFSGFHEYINCLRLEHFKRLVEENSEMNVKELMFLCGFTSAPRFIAISPTSTECLL